ncbi:MAG: hypothetical protein ACRD2L_18010 [Terriglobia bacterium]
MTSSTLASEFVTDTMGLVLRIERRRLGSTAKSIFEAAESGTVTLYIPALVFAEILYLSEKRRISISLQAVADYLEQFPHCKELPMSLTVSDRQPKLPISESYTTD